MKSDLTPDILLEITCWLMTLHAYFKEPKPFLLTSAEIKYDVLTKPLLSSLLKGLTCESLTLIAPLNQSQNMIWSLFSTYNPWSENSNASKVLTICACLKVTWRGNFNFESQGTTFIDVLPAKFFSTLWTRYKDTRHLMHKFSFLKIAKDWLF